MKGTTQLCIHNEIITFELTIDDWNIINKSKKATRTKLDLLKHTTKFNLPNEIIILLLGAKKYLSLILRSCFYLFSKWISLLLNGFIRFHHLLYRFHNFILIKLNTEIVSFIFFFFLQTMFEFCLTARSKLNVIVFLFFTYARNPTSLIKL